MVGSTDDAPKLPDRDEPPKTPTRRTQPRPRTKQKNGGTKSDVKTPVRKSRERPKLLGPGTMARRSNFDKLPLSSSPEKRRAISGNRQAFRMTANRLAVPEWGGRGDTEKGEMAGGKGMDMERDKKDNREVNIKREQIEASASKTMACQN